MSRRAVKSGCSSLALVCALAATPVVAQTAEAIEVADEADERDSAEVIIVTADKRPTVSRDVTGGVNAVDESLLKEARISDVEDIARLVPGFEIGRSSGDQLAYPSIRGVSPQTFGDPTVAILQDGFGFGTSLKAATQDIFDASTVEVLKGPQATLYGANSLGGVVNIISKLPSLTDFEGDFRASYGEYDSVVLRGAVTIPIASDVFAIRVGGYINSRDGYWDNLFNGVEGQDATTEKGARFAARLRPSDFFDSSLVYTFSRTTSDCSDCTNPIIGYDPANPTAIGKGTIDVNNLAEYTNTNLPGPYRRNIHRATWNNTFDFGGVSLNSVSGYGNLSFFSITDTDRGPGNTIFNDILVDEDQEVFSQELRLASDSASRLRWQVGAYYLNSSIDRFGDVGLGLPFRIPIINTLDKFENFAVFTQNTYEVSDRFEFQFGLRYDIAEKRQRNRATNVLGKTKSEALLPKVSALYRLDDLNNVYATVSKGYKTGGINSPVPGAPTTYEPESLWNYEVGLKGVSDDRSFRYELSAYYIDWNNQQVQQSSGINLYINNAGATEVYGAEAALHYEATERLGFDVGLTYNHSRYKQYFDPSGVPAFFGANPDRSGKQTFFAPDFSASVAGRYRVPIGGGYDATFAGDARYTSSRALDPASILVGDPYVLANASISVGDEQKRLTLFANNAFDERYSTAGFLFAGLPPVTHYGAPRVAGIQADFSF